MPSVSTHGVQSCPMLSASVPPATEMNSQEWSQLAFCLLQRDKRGLESNFLCKTFPLGYSDQKLLGWRPNGGPVSTEPLGQQNSALQISTKWFSPCAGLMETNEVLIDVPCQKLSIGLLGLKIPWILQKLLAKRWRAGAPAPTGTAKHVWAQKFTTIAPITTKPAPLEPQCLNY